MLSKGVRSHISVSSDNHFSISFMYSDLDRPSLKLQIGLVKGSFPKKDAYILSEYRVFKRKTTQIIFLRDGPDSKQLSWTVHSPLCV